jgi:hypothetical protein
MKLADVTVEGRLGLENAIKGDSGLEVGGDDRYVLLDCRFPAGAAMRRLTFCKNTGKSSMTSRDSRLDASSIW